MLPPYHNQRRLLQKTNTPDIPFEQIQQSCQANAGFFQKILGGNQWKPGSKNIKRSFSVFAIIAFESWLHRFYLLFHPSSAYICKNLGSFKRKTVKQSACLHVTEEKRPKSLFVNTCSLIAWLRKYSWLPPVGQCNACSVRSSAKYVSHRAIEKYKQKGQKIQAVLLDPK